MVALSDYRLQSLGSIPGALEATSIRGRFPLYSHASFLAKDVE
jgi:hypothetical protein